jgi:putative transposon-encoded protein
MVNTPNKVQKKIVVKSGNAGGISLPKSWIGKQVKVTLIDGEETK